MKKHLSAIFVLMLILLSGQQSRGQLLKELQKATRDVDRTLRQVEQTTKKVTPRNKTPQPPAQNSTRQTPLNSRSAVKETDRPGKATREAVIAQNEKMTQSIRKEGYLPMTVTEATYGYFYTSWKASFSNNFGGSFSAMIFVCTPGNNGEYDLYNRDGKGSIKGDSVSIFFSDIWSNYTYKGRIYQNQSNIVVQGIAIKPGMTRQHADEYSTISFTLTKAADDAGIFVKGMDERKYLDGLVNFFGDHLPNVKCNESTIQTTVVSRDSEGLPTRIIGTYLFDDSNVKDRVSILFEKGLPFLASYLDRTKIPDRPGNSYGENGRLIFSPKSNDRINKLFAESQQITDKENEIGRQESLAKVGREQKKYGTFSCNQCLQKAYGNNPINYVDKVLTPDLKDFEDVEKTRNESIITLSNICNVTIHVVGTQKLLNPKTGTYYVDKTLTLGPQESVSSGREGIFGNSMFTTYATATEPKDRIDDSKMDYFQIIYTKIVSLKKAGRK